MHRLNVQRAYGVDDVVVILAVGTAEEGGTYPRHGLDLVVAGVEVVDDLLGGKVVEVGVGVGVAHHFVPCVGQGLYRFGVFIHPLAHHEEGGLDVIFAQGVDELLGVLVAPW